MKLTSSEQTILQGGQGQVMKKIMQTLVRYGDLLGAEQFADIEGNGHFALHHVLPGIGPRLEMLDELVEAGLRTKFSFTLDPAPPLDFENFDLTPKQKSLFQSTYDSQPHFEECMRQLGLRDENAWTCTPYLPEVGNVPTRGEILAWSESSAVVFANSVLGARTHRNAVIMDLLSNIAGKTPLVGLLTDEGRRADWLIDIRTANRPHPQLLGGAIGRQVVADVPYISGLDRFLGSTEESISRDYLKEMGAACAALGAVGLYHAENITPEAKESGRTLLRPGYKTLVITDELLEELLSTYPDQWDASQSTPQRCMIGCPHVSLEELHWWAREIARELSERGKESVAIPTTIVAAPQIIKAFRQDKGASAALAAHGVCLSSTCLEACMQNQFVSTEAVVTNSNKLRAFSTARMLPDEQLLRILAGDGA